MGNIRKVFTKREYDMLEDLKKKVDEGGGGVVVDATNSNKGVIIPGIGLTINNETPGVLDVALGNGFDDQGIQGDISLAKATTERLGGIIVGDGLQVNEDGTLSVPKLNSNVSIGLPKVQYESTGAYLTYSTFVTKTSDGALVIEPADKTTPGVVRIGTGIAVQNGTISIDQEWLTTFVNGLINEPK